MRLLCWETHSRFVAATLIVCLWAVLPAASWAGQYPGPGGGESTSAGTHSAGTGFEVGAQGLLAPGGYLAGAAAEYFTGRWGVTAGISALAWHAGEYSGYQEWGNGFIVNLRGRYYPMTGARAHKLWLAGGVAIGSVAVEWEERDGGNYYSGDESGIAIVPNFGLGYKFLVMDDKLSINPQLLIGLVAGTGDSALFAGGGAQIGYRF